MHRILGRCAGPRETIGDGHSKKYVGTPDAARGPRRGNSHLTADPARGRRVVVTGAAGFIGRHLIRRLRDEAVSVLAVVRTIPRDGAREPGVDYVERDLERVETLGDVLRGHLAQRRVPDVVRRPAERAPVVADRVWCESDA